MEINKPFMESHKQGIPYHWLCIGCSNTRDVFSACSTWMRQIKGPSWLPLRSTSLISHNSDSESEKCACYSRNNCDKVIKKIENTVIILVQLGVWRSMESHFSDHYFFDVHGLGERDVYLHADNCTKRRHTSTRIVLASITLPSNLDHKGRYFLGMVLP